MEKKHALFISLLVTLLIVGNYLFFYDFSSDREIVVVERVVDGDTLKLEDGRTIRLLNVNAPEKNRPLSDLAFDYLRGFENESVELETAGNDKYERTLGRVYAGEYVNLALVKLGFAHSFLVEESEFKEFRKAEEESREKELGIWEKSEEHGCLKAEINKKDEYVAIDNLCGEIEGWSVKDESTRDFVFPKIDSQKIVLFSEKGVSNEEELYWGRGNVWNDDRDAIFVRDGDGFLVFYDSYGY